MKTMFAPAKLLFSKNRLLLIGLLTSGGFALPLSVHAQTVTAGTDKLLPRVCTNSCTQSAEHIATDDAGNAFALWTEANLGAVGPITVSRYTASTNTWSTPQRPFTEMGRDAKVGMDASGRALAVWIRPQGTNGYGVPIFQLRYSQYIPGQGWSRPGTAWHVEGYQMNNIVFAHARNGRAHVIYSLNDRVRGANTFDPVTRTWTGTNFEALAGPLKMAVNDSGQAIAIAHHNSPYSDAEKVLYVYHHVAAENRWFAQASLEYYENNQYVDGVPIRHSIDSISIALDRFGNAMAMWEKNTTQGTNATTRVLRTSRFIGNAWTWDDRIMPNVSSGNVTNSVMAADLNGNIFAVWTQWIGAYAKTVASRYQPATSSWATPRVIQSGNSHSRDVNLVVDRNNNAYAAWSQRADTSTSGTGGTIFRTTISRFTASNRVWNTPLRVQDAYRTGYFPFLGVDSRGRAVMLWTQNSGRLYSSGAPIKEIRADRVVPY